MSEGPTAGDRSLTPEEEQHLDRVCDAFEQAWQAGRPPAIEPLVAEAPEAVRKELVRELVKLDLAYRARRGERVTPEEYAARFPDYFDTPLRAETRLADGESVRVAPADVPASPEQTRSLPPSAAPWPQVPGYEILAELGRGGMGVVYQARQVAAKRLVALKMIRDGVLAGPEHRARFRIEAEAAARFQHPNLVRIYEVGEHAGLPYFSMEFAEGGGLDKRLAGQPRPPREAAELVRTLADAVQYAHEKQIVHRDLKPANVVLTADGRPLITDFGLAKRLDRDTGVTPSAAVLGTASYMAPEQAEGHARQVGRPADVYALGAILYELLTGRPPFAGDSWHVTVAQVLHDDPVPPTQRRPELPTELEIICLKCLEKRPDDRYASARDLAEDLRRFLCGETISAAPVSEWERQARWAAQAGFEIEEVLTYGVRDAVYKARQVHLNRPVALKVFAAPAQPDPAALARLRQYAETVARLTHPAIVGIYSSGDLHGRTYLAFEYVAGGSLIERYADRPLPPLEAVRLVRPLAEAVQYAHERGVLHGALKPSNVLLSDYDLPKITNFGLGALYDPSVRERRPAFRRLPSYMAPELADGRAADVGPATDVYALGAILYKLLTGEPPFLSQTVAETLEQVRSAPPPAPSAVRADVPPALDAICRRCLAKASGERYATAGELAAALDRFLAADLPAPVSGGKPLPRFHGYEVLRELGEGSLSIVYEARELTSGRRVALKTMRPDIQYERALRTLFQETAESVRQLRHPNIVEVHACHEQNGQLFFVMELLPGGSLARRRVSQLPITEAAGLVATLARTMEAAHGQGLVHGNLKPSKVLLTADGTPKVTGFLVFVNRAQSDSPAGTIAGTELMGTPRYMAPEQLRGDIASIGPSTDLYALGLILYELLTGWLPFRAATLWAMMAQVLHEAPQPPREVRPDVPPDLEAVCLRCLAKEPRERYRSAAALAEDLTCFLRGEPILRLASDEASRPGGEPPLGLATRRPPVRPGTAVPPEPAPGFWARLAGLLSGGRRSR